MKLLTTIVLLNIVFSSMGQSLIKRAETAEYQYDFLEAADLYRKAYYKEKSYKNAIKVAQCNNQTHDYKGVVHWCNKAKFHNELNTEDKLMYALALTQEEQYDSARKWFKKHQNEDDQNDISRNYHSALTKMKINPLKPQFEVTKFHKSTANPEFSPVPFKDGIAYLVPHKGHAEKRTHLGYYDLKYYSSKEDRIIPEFSEHVNSKFHEGPASFTQNDKVIYFTRNKYFHHHTTINKNHVVELGIYKSEKINGHWGKVKKINLMSEGSSIAHPSLTNDEKTIFFASKNDSLGNGKYDLYISHKQNDNEFSKGKNLGNLVNTSGNEVFPWYDQLNNSLYFASDGLGGYGGLDIFKAQLNQNHEVISIENLGAPINSSHDDMSFCYSNAKKGYFSSDREGSDNIYTFKKKEHRFSIEGIVYDKKTGLPLANTKVSVFNEDQLLDYYTTNDEGKYQIELKKDTQYVFSFKKFNYAEKSDTILITESSKILTYLNPSYFKLIGKVIDEEGQPFMDEDFIISIKSTCKEDELTIPPQKNGQFIYDLKDNCTYTITGAKEGYFTYSTEFTTETLNQDVYENILMREIVLNRSIKIENVYFDRRKADLRPKSKKELNKLVRLLNDNPNLIIELGSHTDSRGDDQYNYNLSKQRSESVLNYLFEQGIKSNRVAAKGYGETSPVNNCTNGVSCNEQDHQQNRRTEIKVVGTIKH